MEEPILKRNRQSQDVDDNNYNDDDDDEKDLDEDDIVHDEWDRAYSQEGW